MINFQNAQFSVLASTALILFSSQDFSIDLSALLPPAQPVLEFLGNVAWVLDAALTNTLLLAIAAIEFLAVATPIVARVAVRTACLTVYAGREFGLASQRVAAAVIRAGSDALDFARAVRCLAE